MYIKKFTYYMADFETTVYEGQEYTEVWAAGICEFYTENAQIFNSLESFFDFIRTLPGNLCIFFHNLKFDGSFWLPFLIQKMKWKQAYKKFKTEIGEESYTWIEERYMLNNTFKYSISDRGQWYSIIIKCDRRIVEIRDSLKLLPFSVAQISKAFNTKHKKLEIEYTGFRYAGGSITDEEKEYLKNDLYVPKEALEIMFSEGHNKITIGSCCLSEFKKLYDKQDYVALFPDLTQMTIRENIYGKKTADAYIRKSYKGGWCYLVRGKELKVFHCGLTLDVNSLYPSVMHSSSGCRYPVGAPNFFTGDVPLNILNNEEKYYFIRFKCRFKVKKGYLPFVQIKDSFLYKGNEMLETSDYKIDNKYYRYIQMPDGTLKDSRVVLTMTKTDWILFNEHYNIYDLEILDGCWFHTEIGIFDEYINHYMKIKMESTGAKRTLAKLFLNNLYGKEAASSDSSFKVAYIKESGIVGFIPVKENNKKPGYIPIGSAITSYARNFTIRAAQKNFHGVDKPGFIYADTDSIHCDLKISDIKGCEIDDKNLNKWKLETEWDTAIFTRQKTYIEITNGEFDIKCAGMQPNSKKYFEEGVKNGRYKLEDFKPGLELPGRLKPKRIKGGIILQEGTYIMKS